MKYRLFTFLFSLLYIVAAQAQILDDSTKQVYGFKTITYTTESEIYSDRLKNYTIDTTVNNLHRYNNTYFYNQNYQHLGAFGSASKPVWWEQPAHIGMQYGLNAFGQYAPDPQKVRYYDTKSPFADINYIQNKGLDEIFRGEFTRNVNKQLNFGAKLQRFVANKTLATTGKSQTNKMIDHHSVTAHISYHSKNEKYRILGNYTHFNHIANENGGIRPQTGDSLFTDELINYGLSEVSLVAARNWERRNNWHIYQQYVLFPANKITLFHSADRLVQKNIYYDDAIVNNFVYNNDTIPLYYPEVLNKAPRTYWRNNWHLLENKIGVKGTFGKLWGSIYAQQRSFKRENSKQYYTYDYFSGKVNEYIGGIDARYTHSDDVQFTLNSEYLFKRMYRHIITADKVAPGGNDYKTKATIYLKGLQLSYSRVSVSPTVLQSNHYSDFFNWNNDFKNTVSDVVNAEYAKTFKSGRGFFVYGGYTNINKLVYFDENALAQQANANTGYYMIGVGGKLNAGKWYIEPMGKYTATQGANLLRIPTYYGNVKTYFQDYIFRDALLVQIGFDYFYRYSYNADNYMTITQSFYLNNSFRVTSYNLVDFFINSQISKATVFIRVSHLNQGFGANGYYMGPYYPGQKRAFQLGVTWRFFD